MRRTAKITAARLPLRQSVAFCPSLHRGFPAWIDAEQGLAFSTLAAPVTVTPRVRAGLVLRPVSSTKLKRHRPAAKVRRGH